MPALLFENLIWIRNVSLSIGIFFSRNRDRRLPRLRLPLIGQELPEFADRMAHNPTEHVIEVFPWIDIAVFAGLDETHI